MSVSRPLPPVWASADLKVEIFFHLLHRSNKNPFVFLWVPLEGFGQCLHQQDLLRRLSVCLVYIVVKHGRVSPGTAALHAPCHIVYLV